MNTETQNKINKIIPIIVLIVIVFFVIINTFKNIETSNSTLIADLNKPYDISQIATNQTQQTDTEDLINKLNSVNPNTISNNKINQLSQDFKFTQDIELTNKEFCALLNIAINSNLQDETGISFIQTDIQVNQNSTVQAINITTYAIIDKSIFNNFNIKLNNNLLVVNNYVKNQNNITNKELSNTYSVNGITESQASKELTDLFFNSMFADVYDELITSIQDTFNCYIQYQNNAVLILA